MKRQYKYGILLGVTYVVWTMLVYITGLDTNRIDIGHYGDYTIILAPITLVFLSIRSKKKTSEDGGLRYRDATKVGLLVSLVAYLIYTPFLVVYHNVINPEWLDYMISWQEKTMVSQGVSNEAIKQRIDQIRTGSTDIAHAISGLIFGVVFLGSVISSISFLILRRKKIQTQ